MIKYIIFFVVAVGTFYAGVYYENGRLAGEPDTTIAVMVSALTISSSKYQLRKNFEYLMLIENGEIDKLKKEISTNNELLSGIKSEAESICKEVACSPKHMEVICNAVNN